MRNFYLNDLIDETLVRYYKSFALTLDTSDFCPEKYNDKIRSTIFKNLKHAIKNDKKENKKYQKSLCVKRRKEKLSILKNFKTTRKKAKKQLRLEKKQAKRLAKIDKKNKKEKKQ